MSNDSTKKTIVVALGVCLVCSIIVSTAAVTLKGRQENNKRLDKIKNILAAGNLIKEDGLTDYDTVYREKIESQIINLKSGNIVPAEQYTDKLNIEKFDIKALSEDPEYGERLPSKIDLAQIKRIPKDMAIYFVKDDSGKVQKYILPVYGYGLWSILYGFIALDKDLKTVRGITFYQHGETPGLGGEVDNADWKKSWDGKIAFSDDQKIVIKVIKGKVDPSDPNSKYQIDGLSGATITTRGIDNLVHFWLGENGYGPFLAKQWEVTRNE